MYNFDALQVQLLQGLCQARCIFCIAAHACASIRCFLSLQGQAAPANEMRQYDSQHDEWRLARQARVNKPAYLTQVPCM